ncbi:MAG: N-acyl homoserine lactonase [Desulfuromonas sp.]|nr:MAG: N-acyl homoserine lactonase [Desulfuromonas sp.]
METLQINRCGLPPWVIATPYYNNRPQPLEIQGVRHANRGLFERLAQLPTRDARGAQFNDWMDVAFQLHQWQREETKGSRKSIKNSYLRFLRGWMFDSNSVEGAVLKGWVESRIGLSPTFHHEPIRDRHCEAYFRYTVDRMKGTARTNALFDQLDVLYEFCQDELIRTAPEQTHYTLYRGFNDMAEHHVVAEEGKKRLLVQLNSLLSFTTDFERAWEFGTRVMRAQVPRTKIFFASDMLPSSLLKGEEEVLVIGGQYHVDILTG